MSDHLFSTLGEKRRALEHNIGDTFLKLTPPGKPIAGKNKRKNSMLIPYKNYRRKEVRIPSLQITKAHKKTYPQNR